MNTSQKNRCRRIYERWRRGRLSIDDAFKALMPNRARRLKLWNTAIRALAIYNNVWHNFINNPFLLFFNLVLCENAGKRGYTLRLKDPKLGLHPQNLVFRNRQEQRFAEHGPRFLVPPSRRRAERHARRALASGLHVHAPWRNDPSLFADAIFELDRIVNSGLKLVPIYTSLGYVPNNMELR